MKTLSLLLLTAFATLSLQAQNPEGSWVITVPCDCKDKDEITYKVTFKADGTYDVDLNVNGKVELTGRYWVEGGTITVQNDSNCTAKGVYKFTVEEDRLWMDPIEDACPWRKPPQKAFFTRA